MFDVEPLIFLGLDSLMKSWSDAFDKEGPHQAVMDLVLVGIIIIDVSLPDIIAVCSELFQRELPWLL